MFDQIHALNMAMLLKLFRVVAARIVCNVYLELFVLYLSIKAEWLDEKQKRVDATVIELYRLMQLPLHQDSKPRQVLLRNAPNLSLD